MPIFEYRCDECGASFEKLLKNRQEAVSCPQCGSGKIVRANSTFAPKISSACARREACPSAISGGCCHGGACGCGK
ncbi:MAG: zinc ribbon domain-containing protein [Lentisphaeria bacterium]|nr:zinc ribbon domain-containing protein [Lentisphaeria bacterium]